MLSVNVGTDLLAFFERPGFDGLDAIGNDVTDGSEGRPLAAFEEALE